MMERLSVGFVGTGNVGIAGAFACLCLQVPSEMVLVDLNEKRSRAEALDLMHGQGLTGRIKIVSGDYSELADSQVIVISAGAAQKPGETRLDLLQKNALIFKSIADELDRYAPNAILVVATNPVDVMTYILQELSDRPNGLIMGTGTMLDTSRFRSLLGDFYHVDPQSVHGYILGEHGDSEFPAWSTVTIGGKRIVDNTVLKRPWNPEAMQDLFVNVRDAAYEIIEGKGYTNWAIGVVIATLVHRIVDDRRSILPVSVRLNGDYGLSDVCLSVPSLVSIKGLRHIVEASLPDREMEALHHSASVLKKSMEGLDLSTVSGDS
jgi:L-lactate dehydrogenase